MKYVAVLDVKNTTSFLITSFKGATIGELPANETAEGITFFRGVSMSLDEQLAYFQRLQTYLVATEGHGLDAGLVADTRDPDAARFSSGLRSMLPGIKIVGVGNVPADGYDAMISKNSIQEIRRALKESLGIDPSFDDGRQDPDNPHQAMARKIKSDIGIAWR